MQANRRSAWRDWLPALADQVAWSAVRGAVDAVRYQPAHLRLLVACGVNQPGRPSALAHWLAEAQAQPAVVEALRMPHALLRAVAGRAALWFGPTGSVVVRFFGGVTAAAADHAGAATVERSLRNRAHPGLLVPHPHDVAVLAVDMRGFSQLTLALDDTQYLADLVEEYLSVLTRVIESHRGVVFQYTGDGLLALFLPELTGLAAGEMIDRLLNDVAPALHREFGGLARGWRTSWTAAGRPAVDVGLGVGISYGKVTMGFIGASGKKQFGALGEPVNLASFLCAIAEGGTVLVDQESLARAGFAPLGAKRVRVRSRKLGRRLDALALRWGPRREPRPWLPVPTTSLPEPAP